MSECYTFSAPYTEVPTTCPHTGTWGTLETFTPAVRANKVCTAPRRANATTVNSSHGAQEVLLHAEHDAPVHGHGRDQAVPGPADSLEGRQGWWTSRASTSRSSPARSRTRRTRARPSSSRSGTRSRGTSRPGAPRTLGPASASSARLERHRRPLLGLGRPVNLRPRRRPTLRRPARWRRHVAAPARRCSPEHAI